ncbi:hypothetical protein ACF0H5_021580 [Mactra antiquata]
MTDVLQHNVNIGSPMSNRSPVVMEPVAKSPLHSLIEKLSNTSKPHSDMEEKSEDTDKCMENVRDKVKFRKDNNSTGNIGLFNDVYKDIDETHNIDNAMINTCEKSESGIDNDKFDSGKVNEFDKCILSVGDKKVVSSDYHSEFERSFEEKEDKNKSLNGHTGEENDADIDVENSECESEGMDTDVCNEIKERALKAKDEPRKVLRVGNKVRRKDRHHMYGNYIGRSARNFDMDLPFTDDDSDEDTSISVATKDPLFTFTKCNSNLHENKKELLKFAEVLYKCTLCTSIPSILTSEESFLQHVNEQHLSKENHYHGCKKCSLKLRTEEDLKEHVIGCHTENDDNMSCDLTGSDIIKSHDHLLDSNNESDSDSSGHRQLRTKVVKRSKPVHDFESPKQLVDHTGIQTLNGSLDLSQKNGKPVDKKELDKSRSPLLGNDVNEIDIKQITDQIIKSDVQGRNVNNTSTSKLPLIPSFTPDFGKYTKLVREGGNIVYFCQVCNWKSPIKTTFQVHCNSSSHKSKVQAAENPDENYDSSPRSSKSDTNTNTPKHENTTKDKSSGKRSSSSQDISFGPKMPDHSLFYNYIMRPREVNHSRRRTPIVSPFGTGNFIEDARFTYKRPNEHPVDLAMKKRKRFAKYVKSGINSDSESEDENSEKCGKSLKSNHLSNMTLLRQKLLEGNSNDEFNIPKVTKKHKNDHSHPCDMSVNDNGINKMFHNDEMNIDTKDNKTDIGNRQTDQFCEYMYRNSKRNYVVPQNAGNLPSFSKGGDNSAGKQYRCFACSFEYNEVDEYERHFEKVHKSSYSNYYNSKRDSVNSSRPLWMQGAASFAWNELSGTGTRLRSDIDSDSRHEKNGEPGSNITCEMGENWRVQKLKELLPDYVLECDRGNTSRDYLLQCISNTSGLQDIVLWSSACNRAMRELFPNNTYNITEDIPTCTSLDNDTSMLYQPHRDINIDMEKIVEHLPSILKWTGNMENGIHRQDLLIVLSDAIQDTDVGNWGAQCNRALRLVFPHVDMKRKGKYKTYPLYCQHLS